MCTAVKETGEKNALARSATMLKKAIFPQEKRKLFNQSDKFEWNETDIENTVFIRRGNKKNTEETPQFAVISLCMIERCILYYKE